MSILLRAERNLRRLRQSFLDWAPWLKKATGANEVHVSAVGNGVFSVTVSWKDTSGQLVTHRKVFDKQSVPAIKLRCTRDHARDLITEVLKLRDVI